MLPRRLAFLLPFLAIVLLGTSLTTPAGAVLAPAAVPDPVANLTVGTVTQGANHSWVVPFSWDASPDATGYTVKVTNLAGTEDYGTTKDVPGTSATVTTASLADSNDYRVSVLPKNADGDGDPTTAPFSAIVLDRDAPTGTYTVAPTSAWLAFDFSSFDEQEKSASVTIKQVAVSDNTPSTTITRRVLAGDGSVAKSWPAGSTITVTYTKAGTFTPTVELTDGFGNVGSIQLSPVTVSDDSTGPVVQVKRPAASVRDRIASWRVIRGTATDSGTGVDAVLVMLLQKRGGVWYAYHFRKRTWLKGRTGQIATLTHTKARPAFLSTNSRDRWRTAWIRGLKTGKIVVRTAAFDKSFNIGVAPNVRQRITRP